MLFIIVNKKKRNKKTTNKENSDKLKKYTYS